MRGIARWVSDMNPEQTKQISVLREELILIRGLVQDSKSAQRRCPAFDSMLDYLDFDWLNRVPSANACRVLGLIATNLEESHQEAKHHWCNGDLASAYAMAAIIFRRAAEIFN